MATRRKKRNPRPLGKKTKKPVKSQVRQPTAEDYLRELRSIEDVQDEDFAFFSDELADTAPVEDWISTGSLAIDRLTGGGWPVTRITEVAAWEGVGKSTLLDQSIAQLQREGGVACLIDTESARDERYTRMLGVDVDKLIVHRASTIEDCFSGIDKVLAVQEKKRDEMARVGKKPPVLLIVWDSVGGTPTRGELEGAADDVHVMEAARNIKMNFRRVSKRIAHARAALVFSNHFYTTIGQFASKRTYGGSGIRYFASLRLWLERTGALKVGTNVVGHIVKATIKKTRVAKPAVPAEVGLIWNAGLDNSYTLYEWGKTHDSQQGYTWTSQRGAWAYLVPPEGEHHVFQHQFIGLGQVFREHPELYEAMAQAYLEEGKKDES